MLSDILLETSNPFIIELKQSEGFELYVKRLEFLLWGDTTKYKGPLADGFEKYEWISISLLLSDWLIETMVEARHITSQIVIDELRNNPSNIAAFTIELLTKLIERDVIKIEQKQKILLFLQNEMVINVVISHADDILAVMDKIITATCNLCKKKNTIKNISERDGNRAYNASLSIVNQDRARRLKK